MDGGKPELEAVFWDIGGVILDIESVELTHRMFVDWLVEARDVSVSADEAREIWRDTLGTYFKERDASEFRPARDGYRRAVENILGESVPDRTWRPRFEQVFTETIRPHSGAVETIRTLQDTPIHVGILSDVDTDEGYRILETFGIVDSFDSITTSEAVGKTKPHSSMFETATETAGVFPEDALMIGDRHKHDMEGAKRVGLWTAGYGIQADEYVDFHLDELSDVLDIFDHGCLGKHSE
jgi:putative hydrolase of the HAD superfamily